jgi:hypothetical protein
VLGQYSAIEQAFDPDHSYSRGTILLREISGTGAIHVWNKAIQRVLDVFSSSRRIAWSGYGGRQHERVDATVATTLPISGSAT